MLGVNSRGSWGGKNGGNTYSQLALGARHSEKTEGSMTTEQHDQAIQKLSDAFAVRFPDGLEDVHGGSALSDGEMLGHATAAAPLAYGSYNFNTGNSPSVGPTTGGLLLPRTIDSIASFLQETTDVVSATPAAQLTNTTNKEVVFLATAVHHGVFDSEGQKLLTLIFGLVQIIDADIVSMNKYIYDEAILPRVGELGTGPMFTHTMMTFTEELDRRAGQIKFSGDFLKTPDRLGKALQQIRQVVLGIVSTRVREALYTLMSYCMRPPSTSPGFHSRNSQDMLFNRVMANSQMNGNEAYRAMTEEQNNMHNILGRSGGHREFANIVMARVAAGNGSVDTVLLAKETRNGMALDPAETNPLLGGDQPISSPVRGMIGHMMVVSPGTMSARNDPLASVREVGEIYLAHYDSRNLTMESRKDYAGKPVTGVRRRTRIYNEVDNRHVDIGAEEALFNGLLQYSNNANVLRDMVRLGSKKIYAAGAPYVVVDIETDADEGVNKRTTGTTADRPDIDGTDLLARWTTLKATITRTQAERPANADSVEMKWYMLAIKYLTRTLAYLNIAVLFGRMHMAYEMKAAICFLANGGTAIYVGQEPTFRKNDAAATNESSIHMVLKGKTIVHNGNCLYTVPEAWTHARRGGTGTTWVDHSKTQRDEMGQPLLGKNGEDDGCLELFLIEQEKLDNGECPREFRTTSYHAVTTTANEKDKKQYGSPAFEDFNRHINNLNSISYTAASAAYGMVANTRGFSGPHQHVVERIVQSSMPATLRDPLLVYLSNAGTAKPDEVTTLENGISLLDWSSTAGPEIAGRGVHKTGRIHDCFARVNKASYSLGYSVDTVAKP
jgi:hypothetical protein